MDVLQNIFKLLHFPYFILVIFEIGILYFVNLCQRFKLRKKDYIKDIIRNKNHFIYVLLRTLHIIMRVLLSNSL